MFPVTAPALLPRPANAFILNDFILRFYVSTLLYRRARYEVLSVVCEICKRHLFKSCAGASEYYIPSQG